MLKSFDGTEPEVAESAYVAESAVVIGNVVIEEEASVWPNATIRGDHDTIVLREGANVQDNAVLHEGAVLEKHATVGHGAIVHAATVDERGLVGMNAVVLDDSHVGREALVAAGSVVTEGTDIPANTLATGSPAEVKTEVQDSPWAEAGERYVELSRKHMATSEIVDEDG